MEPPDYKTIEEEFPLNCEIILMTMSDYGSKGQVVGYKNQEDPNCSLLKVKIIETPHLMDDRIKKQINLKNINQSYKPVNKVADQLRTTCRVVEKISGSIKVRAGRGVERRELELGLNLHNYQMGFQVDGYTR